MTKYLFISGPASGEYHETNGELHVAWHETPIFAVEESDDIKPLGIAWAYHLRALAIGETYTHVYVSGSMTNSEAIDAILTAYARSQ